ncbi:unnamed protein product, partial [Rotaria magnacalcarata]
SSESQPTSSSESQPTSSSISSGLQPVSSLISLES